MASLKNAIKEYCKSCTYDSTQPGTYLQQIQDCRVTSCKLYEVRPRTIATINLERDKKNIETGDIAKLIASLEDDETEGII